MRLASDHVAAWGGSETLQPPCPSEPLTGPLIGPVFYVPAQGSTVVATWKIAIPAALSSGFVTEKGVLFKIP
jgi:hypothetical protein